MAMILDAFVQRFLSNLADFVGGEVSSMLKVKDDLQKLQRRLERIRGFIEHAERKRHEDTNIRNWVSELKDIMYDADDIIDLCIIEGRKLSERHQSVSVVCHPFPLFSCFSCMKFRHEIGHRIRDLNNRLKEIVEDRSALPKLEYANQDVQVSRVNPRQTFPIDVNSDIVGKQIESTQGLVDSLLKQDEQNCWILGIVGMGGIGKTTLASKIYHDKRIEENFPIRVWVCVSKDFSETELLKEMIRSAGGDYGQATTKAELTRYLPSVLSKRFIVVLDDMWEAKVWEDLLRYPLERATAGGRIVITTRDINVAANMRALVHHVRKMDSDDGWELLCKKVFRDDEKEEIFNLRDIGSKIVEKCDGLPLAIKTIAGVLRLKKRSSIEWNNVLRSDAWSMSQLQTELPGALFLSYEDLSSDLKQCFLYCSLYPENSSMHRDDLIRYWLAEGFVKPQGDALLEDLAEDYYKELNCRNLLQLHRRSLDDSRCKMHDLLRSLALFLIGDESTFVGDEKTYNTSPLIKLRRLSISNMGERLEIPDAVKKQKCLRTLIVWHSPRIKIIEHELERLGQLRVLDLNDTGLESLPDSIGNLLHLRNLDLDRTNVKNLPESIGRLQNLQTLNLSGCKSLHTLPKGITSLCNLRCLRLEGTPLSHLPKGIGKLRNLVYLEGFVVGDDGGEQDQGCDLEELQSLSQLRVLQIDRLERSRAGASALANICFLRKLLLCWIPPESENNQPGCGEDAIQRVNEICDDLSPPSNLEELRFYGFFGSGFPGWLMSSSSGASFPHLVFLRFHGCRLCPQVPPLGLLPQLKYLDIDGADAIVTIGPELFGPHTSALTAFPRLEYLKLRHMRNLKAWSLGGVEEVGDEISRASKPLPRLNNLHLQDCPELIALPEGLGHATNLQKLLIEGAHNLREIKNLPSLTELYITENPGMERVSNLPTLKYLQILNCPRLKQVENLDKLQFLVLEHPFVLQGPSEIPTDHSPEGLPDVSKNLDQQAEHLPQWLLDLLGQHQNAPTAVQNLRKFVLKCRSPLFKSFLKDAPNFIQWIPEVRIEDIDGPSWIRYTKGTPPTFQTNVQSEES